MIIVQKDAGGGGGKNLKFFYDFEKPAKIFRQVLRLTQLDPAEVDPKRYPHLDVRIFISIDSIVSLFIDS